MLNYVYGQISDPIYISADFQNARISEILREIEEKYPVNFFYKDEWIPDRTLSIESYNESLDEFLNRLLVPMELSFILYGSSVVIAPEKLIGKDFSRDYFITRKRQEELIGTQKWSTTEDILTVGDSVSGSNSALVLVRGKITDELSNEILQGVNLYFEALEKTVTTNEKGNFQINVPPGNNLLEISYVGYETKRMILYVYAGGVINIQLTPDAYELDEVLITGEASDENIQSVMIGITTLKSREIKELPVFLGEADVIRSILTLPGVYSMGEGAGGFNVRGGSIDQNLILQDEALIYNSSHALGFFSVFNPDVIREVTFYKSHIPAQYGGRLSSVLNVQLKGQDHEKITLSGGIGFVTSRLSLEGPLRFTRKKITEPAKTTFLLGGRITYSDWLLRIINNPQVEKSSASFYDLNFKLSHKYSDRGSVTGSYYRSYDFVQFSDQYGFNWENIAGSILWNHLVTPDLSSNFSVSYSQNNNRYFEPYGLSAFNLENGISNMRLKEEFLYSRFDHHNLSAGAEYLKYDIHPENLAPRGDRSAIIPDEIEKDDAREMGVFISDEYVINHLVSVSMGLRYNFFQQIGPGDTFIYEGNLSSSPDSIIDTLYYSRGESIKSFQSLEPRLSLKYSINPTSSVKLAYNRINQYIHLLSNSTAATPIDFWQVSGPYVSPQKVDSYSLGYFRNFSNNIWETSVEIYYRKLYNIIEFKDLPDLLMNDHIETELLSGAGISYGGELYIKKRYGKIHGSLSYSFSRTLSKIDGPSSEEEINQGKWFPSKLDRPHNLNILFNANLNKSNTFSANFTFLSGRPITAPAGGYVVNGMVLPNYSERNQYRIPDYHRLDISYTIKRNVIKRRRYKDSFTFSIYNLYGRKNAYSIFFRKNQGTSVNAYKLSVLGTIFPSITYNFEF
jgi:hypothetical protein